MWGYRHTRTHTQKKLLVGYSFAFLFFKKTAMGKVPLISLLCAQTVQSSDSTSWYDVAQFRKAEIGCWDASGRRYTSMSVGGWIVVVCTICGRYFCSWERPRLLNHRFFSRTQRKKERPRQINTERSLNTNYSSSLSLLSKCFQDLVI